MQTDPTVANAGLTEIDAGTDTALTNGHVNGSDPSAEGETLIPNADVGDGAANAAAENQWDAGNDLAASQEWVEVQKPAEAPATVTVPDPAPAAPAASGTQSWADDHPEPSAESITPADPNDGFQSVQRNRGRGDREGGSRGGRGGPYRGRGGPRDGHRGRGRGGPRGGRGGVRREENASSS